ncbi:MAG: diacylglycerol kinase [Ideonella sp.]|nr:MAG: diacylglycerol kinase [Burkholderiaceae bacterium]MBE7425306.1 diacylglycerol kinase [Ideonella sp.]
MTHPHKAHTGVQRIVRAAGYSVAGLSAAWRHESAFRQECVLAVLMLPAAWWLGRSWTETVLLAGSVVLVLIVELLNSAVESAVDRVSADLHPLSKRAKDLGSAAVMLALLGCAAIWCVALWQRWSAA